jgi:hypothetical protein
MSGMEPALIGAAIGGGGAAVTGKNPFQGALLGGLMGGAGGAFAGGFNAAGPGTLEGLGAMEYPGAPSIMDRVGAGFGSVGSSIQENPMLAGQALNTAGQLFAPHPRQMMGGGGQVSRGQIPQMDYSSLLNPQQSTVLRPQAMSLL